MCVRGDWCIHTWDIMGHAAIVYVLQCIAVCCSTFVYGTWGYRARVWCVAVYCSALWFVAVWFFAMCARGDSCICIYDVRPSLCLYVYMYVCIYVCIFAMSHWGISSLKRQVHHHSTCVLFNVCAEWSMSVCIHVCMYSCMYFCNVALRHLEFETPRATSLDLCFFRFVCRMECVCMYMRMYVCVCMFVCLYVCMCVCMYVYVCMYLCMHL